MKSVIYITTTNSRVYNSGKILQVDSKGPNTDMTFQEINISHLSTNDTTIVSFTEENIVIRTLVPYVSPFPKNYP